MSWYTTADKQRAYRRCAKALRALAVELGIPPSAYDIRHCYGGPAVSGEAIFHSETLYINLPLFPFPGTMGHKGYFRSCKGRKDYKGGPNIWFEGWPAPSADMIRRALPQAFPTPTSTQ